MSQTLTKRCTIKTNKNTDMPVFFNGNILSEFLKQTTFQFNLDILTGILTQLLAISGNKRSLILRLQSILPAPWDSRL